ncbi:MAG: hypothetical protein ACLU4N_04130 [Butyricimonas faecihominis]
MMRWMSLAAFILVLPFGLHQTLEAPLFTSEAPVHIWLELGFVLIFATMIAYFLNLKALLYIRPSWKACIFTSSLSPEPSCQYRSASRNSHGTRSPRINHCRIRIDKQKKKVKAVINKS